MSNNVQEIRIVLSNGKSNSTKEKSEKKANGKKRRRLQFGKTPAAFGERAANRLFGW
jgi:hypothetical protein